MPDLTSLYFPFLGVMAGLAVIVFISLFFVNAGYGMFRTPQWGPSVPTRIGWVIMEAPVFIFMTVLFLASDRTYSAIFLIFFLLFQAHYFHRAFIFPMLIRTSQKMPLSIIAMAIVFNACNVLMQAGWLFYVAPDGLYTNAWLTSPQFIIGVILFVTGMVINIHSDRIIRRLRKPGDTSYHFPKKGMYRYVTSANYFGECIEWLGFACLTWSWGGLVFFIWTFANLAPRAKKLNARYKEQFPEAFAATKPKAIIPFIF
ncbi:MAG: DUF1295 domain-containing protein [Proteobacteria bacterium]|nr:DUF1295 domain-containing protein [Pseudomonadota bacterium]